jgi:hypothetical protein
MKSGSRHRAAARTVLQLIFRPILICACLLLASPARADGGELEMRLGVTNSLAFVRDPLATYNAGPAWVYLPRFSAMLQYDIANAWHVGLGVDTPWPRDAHSTDVTFKGERTDLLVGQIRDWSLPLSFGFVHDSGDFWSTVVDVEGGVSFVQWTRESQSLRRGKIFAPVNKAPTWNTRGFMGLAVRARMRPLDFLVIQFGPQARLLQGGDLHVGLAVDVAWAVGAGPSF